MQIGIRLHDLAPGTLEERLIIAREQGFVCSHLALSKTVKEYPVGRPALVPGYATALRRLFASYGNDIAVLGCYLNLAHPDQGRLEEIRKDYEAHIRFASWLGCGVVGTETGAPNAAYAYEPACHSEEALETLIRNLSGVAECAEKFGVVLAIEPVWNHIVWNSKQAVKVLKAVASPNLQIILDPVNLLSMDNYEDRDRVIAEAIEDLGEAVAVVHIKDFLVEQGALKAVAPGTGLMDYGRVLRFIHQEKPWIQVTLENTRPDNAVRAREYLMSL